MRKNIHVACINNNDLSSLMSAVEWVNSNEYLIVSYESESLSEKNFDIAAKLLQEASEKCCHITSIISVDAKLDVYVLAAAAESVSISPSASISSHVGSNSKSKDSLKKILKKMKRAERFQKLLEMNGDDIVIQGEDALYLDISDHLCSLDQTLAIQQDSSGIIMYDKLKAVA